MCTEHGAAPAHDAAHGRAALQVPRLRQALRGLRESAETREVRDERLKLKSDLKRGLKLVKSGI